MFVSRPDTSAAGQILAVFVQTDRCSSPGRYVGRFVPKKERLAQLGDQRKKFTNVYLKNFGEEFDEDKLKTMCEKYGVVTSAKVMCDDKSGRSKGFGFVSFEDHTAAGKVMGPLSTSWLGFLLKTVGLTVCVEVISVIVES